MLLSSLMLAYGDFILYNLDGFMESFQMDEKQLKTC